MGQTGTGISATCNSILKRRVFPSGASATSKTRKICQEYSKDQDMIIHVMDGPGFGYSGFDPTNANEIFLTEIKIAIALNSAEFDSFIITVKFGERFTRENQNAIEFLKRVFGTGFLRNHCLIVMTGGDMFERERKKTGITLREWLNQQNGPFKDLLEECDNRIVLFDNLTEDNETKTRQVQEVLVLVKKIGDKSGKYTNENVQAVRVSRDQVLRESNVPIPIDELLREVSLILQTIERQSSCEDEVVLRLQELESSSKRCHEIQVRILPIDSESGHLATMINLIDYLQRFISKEISIEYRNQQDRNADIEQLRKDYWTVKGQWETWMVSQTLQKIKSCQFAGH